MALVSVTRLRSRSVRFLPLIALHTWRSFRQARLAEGLIDGYLGLDPKMAFWTITVWTDQASMQAYRNTAEHVRAMPALISSCDEASVAHWTTEDTEPPTPTQAAQALQRHGKLSKVRHPSPEHASGDALPRGGLPQRGPSIRRAPG